MKKRVSTSTLLVTVMLSVAAVLMPQLSDAQMVDPPVEIDAHRGYFIRDSVVHNVYISRDKSLTRPAERFSIPGQPGYEAASFSPDQVLEYGMEDGRRFFSTEVDTPTGPQRFFLEKLRETTSGTYILYLPRRVISPKSDAIYFLRDEDGTVTKIGTGNEPKGIWDYFSTLEGDCLKMKGVKFPRRFRPGMTNRFYNAFMNCNRKVFPEPRFGITAGFGLSQPSVFDDSYTPTTDPRVIHKPDSPLFADLKYDWSYSYSAGVFFRIPMGEVASFQPELLYFHAENTAKDWGHTFVTDAFRVPLLFRLNNNYSRVPVMPYGELGPVFDLNVGRYSYRGGSDLTRVLPRFSMGVAAGVGLECYIAPGQSISIGGRVSWVSNLERAKKYNNLSVEFVLSLCLFKM